MRNTSMFAILIGGCLLQAAAQATRSTIDPLLKQPLDNPVLVDEQLAALYAQACTRTTEAEQSRGLAESG